MRFIEVTVKDDERLGAEGTPLTLNAAYIVGVEPVTDTALRRYGIRTSLVIDGVVEDAKVVYVEDHYSDLVELLVEE